jgi:hypothetical protein
MDAVCGLSIRRHWAGPVICNETERVVCASVVPHGERFHVNAAPKHHLRGTLLSPLLGRGQFLLILPAVQRFEQVPASAKHEGQQVNGCGTGLGLTRCLTHVSREVTSKMDALRPRCICDDFSVQ